MPIQYIQMVFKSSRVRRWNWIAVVMLSLPTAEHRGMPPSTISALDPLPVPQTADSAIRRRAVQKCGHETARLRHQAIGDL